MARKRKENRKDEIRRAAIELISDIGFHKCTTDKIAEKAGISVGTIYNYFDNKKDILSYIFKVEKEKNREYFLNLMKKEIPTDEKIKLFLQHHFQKIYKNQKKSKLLHDESNRPARGIPKEIFSFVQVLRNQLKELIREGMEKNIIDPEKNVDLLSSIIMGSLNSIAIISHLEEEKIESICSKAPEELFSILNDGIFLKN